MDQSRLMGILVALLAAMFPGRAWAGEDTLLNLLREKGILSSEEVDEIKAEEGGFLSLKGAKLGLGGELELEFRDTQKDEGVKDSNARFQLDKFTLKPKVEFEDTDISLKAEIEFNEDKGFFSEGGVCFGGLPLDSRLFAGLGDRFIGISRKTESYPLLATMLWRYEQLQLNWEAEVSPFYCGIAIGEGLKLGTKQVAEDSSYKMLADKRNAGDRTGHLEYGVKLGIRPNIGDWGAINILGFGFWSELSEDDKDILKFYLPNYISNSDKMRRYGGRVVYTYEFDKLRKLDLVGEYAYLEDGELDRNSWYLQCSYKWKFDRPYFRSFEPLIRYGRLDTDWEKAFNEPASWDREKITIALITDVIKNVKIKAEYYINDEETGSRDVDNSEALVQLETKF